MIGTIERMDTLHTKLWELATELGLLAIKTLGYEPRKPSFRKNSTSYELTLDRTTCLHRLGYAVGRSFGHSDPKQEVALA